jgi:hypothetical protein
MWEDFLINTAISTLLMTLKNPKQLAKFKAATLKVYRAIKLAFPAETAAIDAGG